MNVTLSTLKKIRSIRRILIMSTLIGICRTHWLMVWLTLEVNTLAICYKIAKEKKLEKNTERRTFLYYLIQVLASLIIVATASQEINTITQIILIIGVLIKMGAWPLHLWYIKLIESITINDLSLIVIITWQKILPVVILSLMNNSGGTIILVIILATVSIVTPAVNLKPSSSVKRILALSSLNNNGWLILSSLCSIVLFYTFLLLYSISLLTTLKFFKRLKLKNFKKQATFWTTLVVVANIGGIPPLTIFWGKILVIKTLLESGFPTEIVLVIIALACFFLYFYMWIPINETVKTPTKTQIPWKRENKIKTINLIIGGSFLGFLVMITLDLTQRGLSW
jgi:NADH:ubiquinone oxidoreductase subunit 2 (subunit N)